MQLTLSEQKMCANASSQMQLIDMYTNTNANLDKYKT